VVKNPKFAVGTSILSIIIPVIHVFPVSGRHIAIFSCRSLLQSPANNIVELAVIEYSRFAVKISILTVLFLGIKLFPVLAVTLLFPVSIVVSVASVQLLRARRNKSLQICRLVVTSIP